jgi:MerR family transcriptional regulator, thiopeptide resistance regulator
MAMARREWSIQQAARAAGTTSRTLRHYHAIGLLPPSRVGANGYRYYDEAALLRLQRILLLRDLGLGLGAVAQALGGVTEPATALRAHLELLEQERARIGRQIESVRNTLRRIETGERLMAHEMFDGFDHSRYREEVTQRWGEEAWQRGEAWWRALSESERRRFGETQVAIAADFANALRAGSTPDSDEVQAIAQRHFEWVALGWQGRRPTAAAFTGLGEMYVADPRFADAYDRHGAGTAAFVRDAMGTFAERQLH